MNTVPELFSGVTSSFSGVNGHARMVEENIAESKETLSLYSCHPFFHFNGGGLIEFWVESYGVLG